MLLLSPLLFFGVFHFLPRVDPRIVAPHQHFNVVSLVAYIAFVISIFTAAGLVSQRSRPMTWLAMGLASISGLFAVHGLTTPGFLMEHNEIVGAAAQHSLLAGAVFFALAAYAPQTPRLSARRQYLLWIGWLLGMAGYWLIAFFWNTPLAWLHPVQSFVQSAIAAVSFLLYIAAAVRAFVLWQTATWRVARSVFIASVLLAIAVIAQTFGEVWRLSWWSYHLDMLAAFLVVTIELVRTYERLATFRLTRYFVLTAAIFVGILFFGAYEVGNSLLATALEPAARARVEPILLGAVAVLFVLLFAAFLFIVSRGDRLLHERQEHLDQAHQRLESILNAQPDGVVVLAGDGTIERANPVAQRWLDGEDPAIDASELRQVLTKLCLDSAPETEVSFGPITLRARASRFGEGGVVVLFHDISRLKELDRMKTEFVSTVSHELRTPLTNIKLYLSLLRNGKPANRAAYLDTLEQESNRLNALVAKVLDLSRLDSQAAQYAPEATADLNQLVRRISRQYEPMLAGRQLVLTHQLDPAGPWVQGDADMLTQVIVNLLGNAINYTQVGGTIRLATLAAEDHVTLSVSDNGPGIPAADHENIFKRFYRGSAGKESNAPGTGLGLAIVKEIVEQHGGAIELQSEAGAGATFNIMLPRAAIYMDDDPSSITLAANPFLGYVA